MDPTLLLLRWAHILGAIVAMGGLLFARFALVPAVSELDAPTRDRVHDAIRRRWLPWVIGAITLLLASGLANFLLFNARVKAEGWAGGEWMRYTSYHALFGGKFLLALAAFYFASALVGRGAGTQWVRDDRAKWLSVTLGLMLGVVLLSGWMRQLHTGPNQIDASGVGMPSEAGGRRDDDAGDADRDDRYRDGSAGASFRRPADDGDAAPADESAVPAGQPAASSAAAPEGS
ncbi:MAG: hypothetical protein EBX36_08185 [Planctomycetia bacterium]|nr:hypothetical protein [Planctomycetia bacterium]